jgi:hypothetical protein
MRTVTINNTSTDELGFKIRGGAEYGHGIFVLQIFEQSKAANAGLMVSHAISSHRCNRFICVLAIDIYIGLIRNIVAATL